MQQPVLKSGDRLLFQGDSITDAGRDTPPGLGIGYVAMIRGMLSRLHPDLDVEIVNRGVGGDRTPELLTRWQTDCLDIHPSVLSIMIGVNDVWRKFRAWNGQLYIPLADFRNNYIRLLEQAQAAGIKRFVLVSPATITREDRSPENDLLGEYAAVTVELARQFDAIYVPAREAMLKARGNQPQVVWTTDGCHPTTAGHALLATTWLQATGML